MKPRLLLALTASLFLTGCVDSKNPLSDPAASKPDAWLIGVWRSEGENGDITYCHIGRAGENLPDSLMWAVRVTHKDGKVLPRQESLIFPTVLGNKTYLNVVAVSAKKLKRLDEEGWKRQTLGTYLLLRYQVQGDKLLVWLIDDDAKKRAIEEGKIKSVSEDEKPATFTATTENLARFIAEAADSMFSTKPLQCEKVDAAKQP
jgi:hypothetical protein